MGVIVKEDRLFILNTRNTSYAFFRDDDGILVQLYWGKKIERPEDYDTSIRQPPSIKYFSLPIIINGLSFSLQFQCLLAAIILHLSLIHI